MKKKRIAYSYLFADLFHYGHLRMLETARQSADYHICGVISDQVASRWFPTLICNYHERQEVIRNCTFVDEVLCQNSMDPTGNLEHIHRQYPDAELLLVQGHILGTANVLGSDFLRQINGRIIPHHFYSNLSRNHISKIFFNEIVGERDRNNLDFNRIKIADTHYFREQFPTKADTLKKLKSLLTHSIIEKEFVFTVSQWESDETHIIDQTSQLFNGEPIVVRSSGRGEDTMDSSGAGFYESVLDIDSSQPAQIKEAVEKVIASYTRLGPADKNNQVLIQKQTQQVSASGVVFTRNLWTNTPYYLINYDIHSNRTDTVTGGASGSKIEIFRDFPADTLQQVDKRWRNLIMAVKEIETYFGDTALDIEFALNGNDKVVIFQVRPLAANSRFHSLDDDRIKENIHALQQRYRQLKESRKSIGDTFYLSDMAFWNPAELIGDRPHNLSYSLFNHLIMKSSWQDALLPLGYSQTHDDLMVMMGNKPYINVSVAFLSLLPQSLPLELKMRLLRYYNKRLREQPQLHDKIEFQMVDNCFRFDLAQKWEQLREAGFSDADIDRLEQALRQLTENVIATFPRIIQQDNAAIEQLVKGVESIRSRAYSQDPDTLWREKLEAVSRLIDECKQWGIEPFSRVARLAFMGSAFLKSLVGPGYVSATDIERFLNSIDTVATEMSDDFSRFQQRQMSKDAFIDKYGHLRPGTYDMTRLPYRKNSTYLDTSSHSSPGSESGNEQAPKPGDFTVLQSLLTRVCREQGFSATGTGLLSFIRTSIQQRELYKFQYTKNISLALELIAEVGEDLGFNREQLCHLDYYSIVNHRDSCSKEELKNMWALSIQGRQEKHRCDSLVSLPSLIFSDIDLVAVPSYAAKPNYITDLEISGQVVKLDREKGDVNIDDMIVVLENADPGFDWIFTHRIRGLITKYGGAASHMAIRCAEFHLPAAIGCGEILFEKVMRNDTVELNCKDKFIRTGNTVNPPVK